MSAHILPYVLYQEVAERLRQDIYRQHLKAREWIDEKARAGRYGISHTPLREALKVLHAEGLVTLVPRRGCYVKALSSVELDEIFPVMALLEGRCAYEAVAKANGRARVSRTGSRSGADTFVARRLPQCRGARGGRIPQSRWRA